MEAIVLEESMDLTLIRVEQRYYYYLHKIILKNQYMEFMFIETLHTIKIK